MVPGGHGHIIRFAGAGIFMRPGVKFNQGIARVWRGQGGFAPQRRTWLSTGRHSFNLRNIKLKEINFIYYCGLGGHTTPTNLSFSSVSGAGLVVVISRKPCL